MFILRHIISAITAVAAVVLLFGAGFMACIAPFTTSTLASWFADDASSVFNRTQLVQVANATRDYCFGSHSLQELYRTIYSIDKEHKEFVERDGGSLPAHYPAVDQVLDESNINHYNAAFSGASEKYCFSPDAISHLDDVHKIVAVVYPILAATLIVMIICCVSLGCMGMASSIFSALRCSAFVVLILMLVMLIWGIISFGSFFEVFHSIFFSQGNWTFSADSLLICALPTPFWIGMGIVWFLVSFLLSLIIIKTTKKQVKGKRRKRSRNASAHENETMPTQSLKGVVSEYE